jgi:hypothetical protein
MEWYIQVCVVWTRLAHNIGCFLDGVCERKKVAGREGQGL